ncbi:methyl-accepting chemotaxis protein [Vibrio sp. L3-7]|uniref:methyl-accepting chemotaxis protein n=1 Tax=Vibrio sp. L3-7 TaxID=2912253 RepID=UPI0011924D77|nr:methyl-accepting chemotaxis protein [Vibrio sp. L3-7]MCF7506190.1 methyl-accepting chemotaxis protein [Vibrio sp. L3-7]TVU70484.1 methyl-accepting chemotaxis protein [Vibrio tasmaniensis]
MKFQSKIILTTSLLFLSVITCIGLIQQQATSNTFKENIHRSVQELIKSVGYTVSYQLNASRELVGSVVHSLNMIDATNHDLAYKAISTSTLKSSFQAVGIGYENNGLLISNDGWIPDENYDVRSRPWYIAASQSNDIVVTKPYVDSSTGDMIISVSSSINDPNDQFLGNVVFDVSLNPLAQLVNQTNLFDSGYLFMVTGDGTTIAHPNSDYNGQPLTEFAPGVELETGVKEVMLNDALHLISLQKVKGEDWYIGALVNEERVFSSLNDLTSHLILMASISVIVISILLYWVIGYLFRPIKELNSAIKNIASGEADLTHRLKTDNDLEFAELAENFNQFVENLQVQMLDSKRVASTLKSQADTTQKTTQDTGFNVNHQMSELRSLVTAMEQMSASARDTAKSAQDAAESANFAEKNVVESVDVVQQTEQTIKSLSLSIKHASTQSDNLTEATNSITSILDVISEIANQTNLLALNATIESARAGQAGRGFAVVADHVRLLSLKTQESTTEIHSKINQLKNGTSSMAQAITVSEANARDAISCAKKATEALSSVQANITHISGFNDQIAAAAEEQSSVSIEINRNTQQISQLSQQIAEQAVEMSSGMDAQLSEIDKQQQILERFKL